MYTVDVTMHQQMLSWLRAYNYYNQLNYPSLRIFFDQNSQQMIARGIDKLMLSDDIFSPPPCPIVADSITICGFDVSQMPLNWIRQANRLWFRNSVNIKSLETKLRNVPANNVVIYTSIEEPISIPNLTYIDSLIINVLHNNNGDITYRHSGGNRGGLHPECEHMITFRTPTESYQSSDIFEIQEILIERGFPDLA